MPRIVMMIPLRRCGSNAIRVRMNLHPDFYSPYPLHLVDVMHALESYGDLGDDQNYFRLVVDMVALQSFSLVKWPDIVFDPIQLFEKLRNKKRSIFMVYGEMLHELAEKRGVSVVMDKCQDSVDHFEEMVECFPDMLFLDVVRDPRAQISSMNQSIIYDFDTLLNTQRWIQSRRHVEHIMQKYPDKILTIRFEDFVEDHENTMRTICDFMGIPFNPVILDVSRSNEARAMSVLSPLWETNYSPPVPDNIYKFTKYLSYPEIVAIEHMTLEWMDRYGYVPMTNHREGFTYNIETALQNHKQKKEQAWDDLKKNHEQDFVLRTARMRFIQSLTP